MNPQHIKVKHTTLDLEQLKRDARRINNKVVKEYANREIPKGTTYQSVLSDQLQEAPMSSRLHDFYNVFTFPYDGINQLCQEIISFFKEVNPYPDQYYFHAWLNYQSKGQCIPWHYHWKGLSGLDRTFVCSAYINAEPSVTTYKFDNGFVDARPNINNSITLYEDVGDIHMVDVWEQDEPRISISMDFVPMKYIQGTPFILNTWMPVI